jgi:hypothetical protein
LLNTILNLAEFELVQDELKAVGYPEVRLNVNALGDDDYISGGTMAHLAAVAMMYKYILGDDVINVKKFFISPRVSEYLRKMISTEGVIGYPARTISSIMWRKPGSMGENDGMSRLVEIREAWKKTVSRGCDRDTVYELMLEDMAGAVGLRKDEVQGIVHTPKSVGGLGVAPTSNNWVSLETYSDAEVTFKEGTRMLWWLKVEDSVRKSIVMTMLGVVNVEPQYRVVRVTHKPVHFIGVTSPFTKWQPGIRAKGIPVPAWDEKMSTTQVMIKRTEYGMGLIKDEELKELITNWGFTNRLTKPMIRKWVIKGLSIEIDNWLMSGAFMSRIAKVVETRFSSAQAPGGRRWNVNDWLIWSADAEAKSAFVIPYQFGIIGE